MVVIHTIHDLNARNPTSSSTPPQLERITDAEQRFSRFSVIDAVHLKLKLQALDNAVSSIRPEKHDEADIARITNACQTRPFEETVYVAGSEEFYLAVKGLPRPHIIADVYAEAYKRVLQGRPYVNNYNLSGCSGIECVFSEVRPRLGDIDRVCDTNLEGAFAKLEEGVKPFPFLRLPAELRLHVYSLLLPPERRIVLGPRIHAFTRPRLNIMRANRQLHNEVRKYFYKNWRLCVRVGTSLVNRDPRRVHDTLNYQGTIPNINPATLELLKELEICVHKHRSYSITTAPHSSPISYVFDTLKFERVHITFEPHESFWGRTADINLEPFGRWLIAQIPASVDVSWPHTDAAAFFHSTAVEQRLYQALQERASSESGQTVTVPEV